LNTKKIYIVRHGQTDLNLKGIVQGSGIDSSLNDTGRAQAFAFFEAYQHIPFDKVYTSALKRSQESVEKFVQRGIPFEGLSGLNEISWGKKEGERITPEEDKYYHYLLDQWQKGNTSLRIEGGESPEGVVIRMKPAVKHILSKENEKIILICMHGRAIRILLCYLLNYPLKSMAMFEHENSCLYILNYTGTMFNVELHNNVAHLETALTQNKIVIAN